MKSTVSEDPLYSVFEEHLHSGLYDKAPTEHFVRDVVDFYFHQLKRVGNIPQPWEETLRQDLSQDVQEMLRAKTYGHYDIGEYNRRRQKKSS